MSAASMLQSTVSQLRDAIVKASSATEAQAAVRFMLQAHNEALDAIEKLAVVATQSESSTASGGSTMQAVQASIAVMTASPKGQSSNKRKPPTESRCVGGL